jgi:hypothetical protein
MPGAWCTRGLVCSEKSTRVRNRGYAEQSGIPCAMGYSLSRALPSVRALIATVARKIALNLPSMGFKLSTESASRSSLKTFARIEASPLSIQRQRAH